MFDFDELEGDDEAGGGEGATPAAADGGAKEEPVPPPVFSPPPRVTEAAKEEVKKEEPPAPKPAEEEKKPEAVAEKAAEEDARKAEAPAEKPPEVPKAPARSLEVVRQLVEAGRPNEAEELAWDLLGKAPVPTGVQKYRLQKARLQALLHPRYKPRPPPVPLTKRPLQLAKSLADEQPNDTSLQGLLGRALALEGKRKEAEDIWKRAAGREGPDGEVQRLLKSLVIMEDEKARGNVAFKDGKWEAACQAYTRALDADVHRVDRDMAAAVLGNRSAASRKLTNFQGALQDAEESAALAPKYVKAHFRRGVALLELERYKEAHEALLLVKREDPKLAGLDDWIERAQHWSAHASHKNHYGALGVCIDASQEDIKKAHKRMALKYHPDKASPEDREDCEARFKAAQEAFEVISDEKGRELYDLGRNKPPPIEQQPLPRRLRELGVKVRKGDGKTTCMICGYYAETDLDKRGHIRASGHPGFYETKR
mmetsp:Transcript_39876/g.120719  ORF Transcript_39876/g.120719 Transcript_39876/m.120719 type:complete len:483 (+) Transcript_39876:72-1520(+)